MSNEQQNEDVTWQRLETQLKWYDDKSGFNQRMFKRLKTATLAISVSIPLCALLINWHPIIGAVLTGAMGATITLLESLQQLNQYREKWTNYRSTAEALNHEKYLYLSRAGIYLTATNPTAVLAENVERLVSQEHARWTSLQEQTQKPKAGGATP